MKKKITAMTLSAVAAVGFTVAAGAELLSYSPWQNPGALTTGVRCAGAALLLAAWPVATVVIFLVRGFVRELRATGLSTGELIALEFVAAEAAHLALHEHNRREAARLTESVMGEERGDLWPGN